MARWGSMVVKLERDESRIRKQCLALTGSFLISSVSKIPLVFVECLGHTDFGACVCQAAARL